MGKVRPSGALAWSTYLGGGIKVDASDGEAGNAIAVRTLTRHGSTETEAYVAGETTAADFPLANAFQNVHAGGSNDAFVARLSSTGSALIYSTFLGGAGHPYLRPDEAVRGIAIGADGSAYVVGSNDLGRLLLSARRRLSRGTAGRRRRLPRVGPARRCLVAKLAPAGLQFSTLLGGGYGDRARAVALDSAGAVYVAGETKSTTVNLPDAFPTVPQAQRPRPERRFRTGSWKGRRRRHSCRSSSRPLPTPPRRAPTSPTTSSSRTTAARKKASNVAVVYTLSSEVELRSLATTAGECTVTAAKKVICNFGALLPLSQVDVSIVVRPNKKAQ